MARLNVGAFFGDEAFYNGDWLMRAGAAKGGLYGNNAEEAMYPYTRTDGTGETLDGSKPNYTITFPAGELPPVNAFWSVTLYDGKSQFLIKNPINRYLLNSPMLSSMKKKADRSLTLYIQKTVPAPIRRPIGYLHLMTRYILSCACTGRNLRLLQSCQPVTAHRSRQQ
jgi:hypothetical protein